MRLQQLLIRLLIFVIVFFIAPKLVLVGIEKGAIDEVMVLVMV